jgi:hypothetical protein
MQAWRSSIKVIPLLEAAAADYVSNNQARPNRTEPSDKSS